MTWHRGRRKRLGKRGEVRAEKDYSLQSKKNKSWEVYISLTFTIIIITTAIITLTTILIVQIIIIIKN